MKRKQFFALLMAVSLLVGATACDQTPNTPVDGSAVSSLVSSTGDGSSAPHLSSPGDSTDVPSSEPVSSEPVPSDADSSDVSSTGTDTPVSSQSPSQNTSSEQTLSGNTSSENTASFPEIPMEEGVNAILLCSGSTVETEGTGVSVAGNVINVTVPGEYRFSGKWNGRIVVNVLETEDVKLAFYGFTGTCSNNAVVEVLSADDVTLKAQRGFDNFLLDTDSSAEKETDTRAKAAVYAKSSLEFSGAGSLTVKSSYKHAVACTKKLIISNSTLTVDGADDGLKGNNSVQMTGGTVTVTAGGDGIKTEDVADATKGFVSLEGGTLKITAKGDGVEATRTFNLLGADVTVVANGTDSNSGGSSKGVKVGDDTVGAAAKMNLSSGTLSVTANGHALRSTGTCTVQGTAKVTLSSVKNGITSEGNLDIRGGAITVTKAEEGLETKTGNLTVSGGTVTVTAADNGLNVSSSTRSLIVSGGTVDVTVTGSEADAIDSNGKMTLQGGLVVAKSKGKSAVNVEKTLTVSAGNLIALGPVLTTPATSSAACTALFPGKTWDKGSYTVVCGGSLSASFTLTDSYTDGYIACIGMKNGTKCTVKKDGTAFAEWTQSSKSQTVS